MDVAERLAQTRGFNGFSYADVAAELAITKPALHYHFASKAELGQALMARYTRRFEAALHGIDDHEGDARSRLRAYADLYAQVLHGERMCLCGMLAAEYLTLPPKLRAAVRQFLGLNEAWLVRVLERGRDEGALAFDGEAAEVAQMIISGLEGALLVARLYGDVARFRHAARRLIDSIAV